VNAPRRHRSNGSARRSALAALVASSLLLVLGVALAQSKGVVASFGEQGTGNGQFNSPAGVAVNETTDEVYVVDEDNDRVQRFDADGDYISQFGSTGPGNGQFDFADPKTNPSIAVDNSGGPSDGSVYVTDVGNNRVQKFDAAGNFLLAFGSSGTANGQFDRPDGVAVDPSSGSVYVVDGGNNRVQKFDAAGNFLLAFGSSGTGDGQFEFFRSPFGLEGGEVAVDSTGDVYVLQRFDRVQRFDSAGNFEQVSPFFGGRLITVDLNDHVYTDDNGSTITERDLSGAVLETHTTGGGNGRAVNTSTDQIYSSDGAGNRVFILDETLPPTATIDPVTDITATSAILNGQINPNGPPNARYRFEYSIDGSTWLPIPVPNASVGTGTVDVPVSEALEPDGGLDPNTEYQVRLVVTKDFGGGSDISSTATFTTDTVAPRAETIGWPIRTAGTASLAARVNPRGLATTYYFEWGETTAYGNITPATEDGDAGDGIRGILVLEEISGLQPDTTYHYRVVAENGAGSVVGDDRKVHTRVSDAPLEHGQFPGPPNSDRAYELVSMPDPNGNPVFPGFETISDGGNRAVYSVAGGTDGSENGFIFSHKFAERTTRGWQTRQIQPSRTDAPGADWEYFGTSPDLSVIATSNEGTNVTPSVWRLFPDGNASKVMDIAASGAGTATRFSRDTSRIIILHPESLDPAHPTPPPPLGEHGYLYDAGSGSPELVSILPDGTAACVPGGNAGSSGWAFSITSDASIYQVSADGSRLFFPVYPSDTDCSDEASGFSGLAALYMRDMDSSSTTLISGPPLLGPDRGVAFISATPGDATDPAPAAFFWTESTLDPDDNGSDGNAALFGGSGGDVYRYGITDGSKECLTCVVTEADVALANKGFESVAVAEDGSRLYFSSGKRLITGEGIQGQSNVYRLDVATGDLKYVATSNEPIGDSASGRALSPDGSVLVFRSAHPSLNTLTDSDNGGFAQYYRYDDRDGSLLCVSCPSSEASTEGVPSQISRGNRNSLRATPLSADGETLAFATADSLVPADQNSPPPSQDPSRGVDVYEWRDGRVLLISDGTSDWPAELGPKVSGITADGESILFNVSARLTPDAVDAYNRLYVARIGGGFEFPVPPPPCSLEVCQGDPKGAPDLVNPGSANFSGPSNAELRPSKRRCAKGKVRRGKRCLSKKQARRQGSRQRHRGAK
jgi:DNA-binding beta-propeller fold protein YncE